MSLILSPAVAYRGVGYFRSEDVRFGPVNFIFNII